MASSLDLKLVLKHLANGTLGENLCRVCLKPLAEDSENIFTQICKENKEYCIADVLKELCGIEISDMDHYSVCSECFIAASNAYKFYLNTKCNNELLHYYVDELENYLNTINNTEGLPGESICISLPVVSTEMTCFDYSFQKPQNVNYESIEDKSVKASQSSDQTVSVKSKNSFKTKIDSDDEEIVIIKDESGVSTFYKMQPNGVLEQVENNFKSRPARSQPVNNLGKKRRKKREPMTSKKCTRCPIQYRFIAKLQEHMRKEHGVMLYSCKVCQALTEDEEFHKFHIKTHTNLYKCDICSVTFKKRDPIINHMKNHKSIENASSAPGHVCVHCGLIFEDNESLLIHDNVEHYRKFACYYCGRIYKAKESYDKHIQKHEMYTKAYEESRKQQEKRTFTDAEAKQLIARCEADEPAREHTCELCGRGFLGARALLWHRRLHTNERPFKCDTCGRAFVSLNRRNQHALCAHTPPARRCPLCPARFHLRAMVNTHLRKVHLQAHKRRARTVAAGDASAAPVPVQELSVALQRRVLELQALHDATSNGDQR